MTAGSQTGTSGAYNSGLLYSTVVVWKPGSKVRDVSRGGWICSDCVLVDGFLTVAVLCCFASQCCAGLLSLAQGAY